jgi:hypothetical protein
MRTLETVRIIDIAGTLIPLSLLAAIATLTIDFVRGYLGVRTDYITISVFPFFISTYARKRVVNKIVHDCKHNLFPINPDSRAGLSGKCKTNALGCKGIQRGLLKDTQQHKCIKI